MKDLQLSLIGVRTNSAGRRNGVANAPTALRSAGLVDALDRVCGVRDAGDVSFSKPIAERDAGSGIISYSSLASMVRSVRNSVSRVLQGGRFPLVIGGDCPVLLGCVAASVDTYPTGLLFVDGQEDAYPAHQSPTGEAADMELGFALGIEVPKLVREAVGWVPLVDPTKVCILGARDKKALQKTNSKSLDNGRIAFYNDGHCAEATLRHWLVGQCGS